jgi:hypothetical protein
MEYVIKIPCCSLEPIHCLLLDVHMLASLCWFEFDWQFDSRPLKVRNRPPPNLFPTSELRVQYVIGKISTRARKFGLNLVAIRLCSRELWARKVLRLQPGQFRDNFETLTWESREKESFGCSLGGVAQRILYGGRWWLPPSSGRGVSCGPKCSWLVTTPKGVPEMWTNHFVVCFDGDSSLIY